jgi:undecaprenyl-diphosphatase
LLVASAAFISLAVVARAVAYFPIDLTISRALQALHATIFDHLMYGLTWLGFTPQAGVVGGVVIVLLFAVGLRWEAVATLFAAGGSLVTMIVKLLVYRPRPTPDLVRVLSHLNSWSFPSGHVVTFTTFCGFLAFLCYTLLKPSWGRTALLIGLALMIVLVGVSRIYEGQHWFSDVVGGYLLGSLWLALSIEFYRWGKPRFFVRQPIAPEVPVSSR